MDMLLCLHGRMILELGLNQAADVKTIAGKYGLVVEQVIKDLSDIPRVLIAAAP